MSDEQSKTWRDEIRADFQRPGTLRAWLRLAAWAILAYGLVAPIIRLTVGYDSIGFPITLAAAMAAVLWVVPRQREVRTWVFYGVAMYFFTQLRDAADETSIRASTVYVLDWEVWMFGGDTPSAWLQDRVGGADGNPGVVAYMATFLHWSWFIFPHAVVIGTFIVARRWFFRVSMIMVGTFFFAVVLYYLVPTVPPWLAAENGATGGISRVLDDTGPTIFGQSLWDSMFDLFAKPNARAAMPSLHFAAALEVVIIALLLRSRRLLAVSLMYSASLGFSLVYLGEHYVADILAGGGAAVAAFFIVETVLGNGPGARVGRRCLRFLKARPAALPQMPELPQRRSAEPVSRWPRREQG